MVTDDICDVSMTTVVRLALIVFLSGSAVLMTRELRDVHRRGMARVHRGQSWGQR